jgi:hypothetical protein
MGVMRLPTPSPGKKLITDSNYLAALFSKNIREFWQGLLPQPWMLIFQFPALGINHHRGHLVALQQSQAHL